MVVLVVLEAFVIAVLALLVLGLLRSHAEILRALHDLGAGVGGHGPAGRTSPVEIRTRPGVPEPRVDGDRTAFDIAGVDPWGEAVAVGVAGVAHGTLLAFLTSGCTTCATFWDTFADPRLDIPGGGRLVIVAKSPAEESQARLQAVAPRHQVVVLSTDAWRDYRVPGSPYFLYVDGPSGRVIGEGTGASWPQVEQFLSQALADAGLIAPVNERDRPSRINDDLLAAGITPGHPSLFPERAEERPDDEREATE